MPTRATIPYPPAPWRLMGRAVQSAHLVEIAAVRPLVPPELRIVQVLPGRTLAIVYAAAYTEDSVLEYNELIVASALVRAGRHFGFWISHIYVDNLNSLTGGREIWGLPKEMAQFEWGENGLSLTVRQDNQTLCDLRYGRTRWLVRLPLLLPAFGALGSRLVWFQGRATSRFGLGSTTLDVPADSPLAALRIGRARLTVHSRDLRFSIAAPHTVGQLRQPRTFPPVDAEPFL